MRRRNSRHLSNQQNHAGANAPGYNARPCSRALPTPAVPMLNARESVFAFQPNEWTEQPPIVRVTIGRIDVRATPPAAPPRKSSARSEPT